MPAIDKYISEMLDAGGSILHIGAGRRPMYRLNDRLTEFGSGELDAAKVESMLREICPKERWSVFTSTHDIDFTYTMDSNTRFRCNFLMDRYGIAAVLESIPAVVPSLDDLEAPQVFKDICHLPGGLVLICGPAGAGTGTTQAAMLEYINEHTARYIITIGSLVEYTHKAIRSVVEQCEVTDETFAVTLEAALNSHPNVIVLDALPDAASIRLALRASMMGILVIAATPAANYYKTIDYIIDAFPAKEQSEARALLAESLQAILTQMHCHGSKGGRVVCREVLLRAEGVPTAVRENNMMMLRNVMDQYRQQGMRTLDFSLRELLATGKITAEEAYARAVDKRQFQNFLSSV